MSRQLSTQQRAPSRPSRSNNTFDNNVLKNIHIFRNTPPPPPLEVDLNTCELGWSRLKKRGVDHNYFNGASATDVEDEVDDGRFMIGSSDFSQAPCAIRKILDDNQNCSAYVYSSASSSDQGQTPVFTALVLPTSYGPPTNTALRLADETVVPFSSLGLDWEEAKHNPRLLYLTKKPESASISNEEFTPFLPDLRTKDKKLVVDRVSFEFEDAHGNIVTGTKDLTKALDAFINEFFDDHFRPKDDDNEAATKASLNRVSFASQFFVSCNQISLLIRELSHRPTSLGG